MEEVYNLKTLVNFHSVKGSIYLISINQSFQRIVLCSPPLIDQGNGSLAVKV